MKAFYQVVMIGLMFSILFVYSVQKNLFASDVHGAGLKEIVSILG